MASGAVITHKNDKSSYIGKQLYNNIQCYFNKLLCTKKCLICEKIMKLHFTEHFIYFTIL